MNFAISIFCNGCIAVQGQNYITNRDIKKLKDSITLSMLYYQKSVICFYTNNESEYAWVYTTANVDQQETAMLLLEYPHLIWIVDIRLSLGLNFFTEIKKAESRSGKS